jgi:hypothetical protein
MTSHNSTTGYHPPSTDESKMSIPWGYVLVTSIVLYPIIQQYLRYARERAMLKKFNYPTRTSMAKMTNQDAFLIQKYIASLEFPKLFESSIQFALFRVRESTLLEKASTYDSHIN